MLGILRNSLEFPESWEFISQGLIMLDDWNFPVVITLLQSFISKICLINNYHAPLTYCCVLTSQSSRFLAHESAASQPLKLNSPCIHGSKVALFSGFHLIIHSGSQCHLQSMLADQSGQFRAGSSPFVSSFARLHLKS